MSDEEFKTAVLEILRDLVWVCSVMATEIIRVVENTAVAIKGESVLERCAPEHNEICKKLVEIAEKYRPGEKVLRRHVLGH
ncbi:MAG: hypothetical protein QXZ14_11925 [Candidatus Jordarchaeales archaeon]|nr:hypothetical protein [Candidatus Jordarchaeia archaeon]